MKHTGKENGHFFHLLILWILGTGISIFNNSRIEDTAIVWRELGDQIGWQMIAGMISLPTSFMHMMTFSGNALYRPEGDGFLSLLIVYWALLVFFQYRYIFHGEKWALGCAAFMIIVSSFRWFWYSVAIISI